VLLLLITAAASASACCLLVSKRVRKMIKLRLCPCFFRCRMAIELVMVVAAGEWWGRGAGVLVMNVNVVLAVSLI
jgi:hypothetical protein